MVILNQAQESSEIDDAYTRLKISRDFISKSTLACRFSRFWERLVPGTSLTELKNNGPVCIRSLRK